MNTLILLGLNLFVLFSNIYVCRSEALELLKVAEVIRAKAIELVIDLREMGKTSEANELQQEVDALFKLEVDANDTYTPNASSSDQLKLEQLLTQSTTKLEQSIVKFKAFLSTS